MKKENVFIGNLIVDKDSVIDYTEVTGYITILNSANLEAPELKIVGDSVEVRENANLEAPALKAVGGSVDVWMNANLPALTAVGGSVEVWRTADLPTLKTVGGCVRARTNTELPALKAVGKHVAVYENARLPALNIVGDSIFVHNNYGLPALKMVGGYVFVHNNYELNSPTLKTVGGYIVGYENAKLKVPHLKTVGGLIKMWDKAELKAHKEMKFNVPGAEEECRRELMREFEAEGYSFADGILAKIVSRRGNVWRVVVCGKKEISYVVSNGYAYSHGKTLKEARDGLMYKISSRDKSKFKTWTLDRVVSKAEAIEAYRVITGACEAGVRQWMEHHKTPDRITVKGIIELTKDTYGDKEFETFFTK